MIVTMPFIPEVCDYQAAAQKFLAAGACRNHSLYIIARNRDAILATDFKKEVENLFGKCAIVFLRDRNWLSYALSNDFFYTACKTANAHEDRPEEYSGAPMLYLDPTFAPAKERWLDLLQAEYITAGKMVLGIATKSKPIRVISQSVGREVTYDGAYEFTGPVVVWRDIWRDSTMLPNLTPGTPWRLSMRWELSASHQHAAKLFFGGKDGLLAPLKKAVVPEPPAKKPAAKTDRKDDDQ